MINDIQSQQISPCALDIERLELEISQLGDEVKAAGFQVSKKQERLDAVAKGE